MRKMRKMMHETLDCLKISFFSFLIFHYSWGTIDFKGGCVYLQIFFKYNIKY